MWHGVSSRRVFLRRLRAPPRRDAGGARYRQRAPRRLAVERLLVLFHDGRGRRGPRVLRPLPRRLDLQLLKRAGGAGARDSPAGAQAREIRRQAGSREPVPARTLAAERSREAVSHLASRPSASAAPLSASSCISLAGRRPRREKMGQKGWSVSPPIPGSGSTPCLRRWLGRAMPPRSTPRPWTSLAGAARRGSANR